MLMSMADGLLNGLAPTKVVASGKLLPLTQACKYDLSRLKGL